MTKLSILLFILLLGNVAAEEEFVPVETLDEIREELQELGSPVRMVDTEVLDEMKEEVRRGFGKDAELETLDKLKNEVVSWKLTKEEDFVPLETLDDIREELGSYADQIVDEQVLDEIEEELRYDFGTAVVKPETLEELKDEVANWKFTAEEEELVELDRLDAAGVTEKERQVASEEEFVDEQVVKDIKKKLQDFEKAVEPETLAKIKVELLDEEFVELDTVEGPTEDIIFAEQEFVELDTLKELTEDLFAEQEEVVDLDEIDEEFVGEYGDDEELAFDEVVTINLNDYMKTSNLRGTKTTSRKLPYIGANRYCNFCANGRAPTRNVAVAVLGMPGRHTCMGLYNKGRASRIPFNLCPIMKTALKQKCGCTGSGGNSSTRKWSGNRTNNRRKSSNRRSGWKTRASSSGRWSWSVARNTDYSHRFLRFLNLID